MYEDALKEFRQAEQNLNYADPEYIDIAIQQYNTALERLELEIRKAKEDYTP